MRTSWGRRLAAGVDEFIAALASERGCTQHTLTAYRSDLHQYLDFLAGRAPEPRSVGRFAVVLRRRQLAPSSVARKLTAVRGFHHFLVAEGLASDDPTQLLAMPRRPQSLPKALAFEEVEALLAAPDPSTSLGRRDRALLEFLYASGARAAETSALDMEALELQAGVATVTGKGNRQRLVPLGKRAVETLIEYLPDRRQLIGARPDPGAVFVNARGGRLSRQAIFRIVRAAAAKAGLAVSVSPHVLRHSAATHMVERGADLRVVQELLGHASISTTQTYTRVTPGHSHEVYVTAHPRSR